MAKTGFYSIYELKDTTAIADSTLTTTTNSDFADISLVKNDIDMPNYATLEKDFFVLDGTLPEFPDTPTDIVYFSSILSGADGTFTTNPSFTVTFTGNHSSYGLTFYFVGDYPLEMIVKWYDLNNTKIDQKTYTVTANQFLAQNLVENYGKLEIEFTKAKPSRYVKFRFIEYGTNLIFGAGGLPVKEASLIEEVDPTSDKIPINKLTYKLIDEDNEFNVGNQSGLHKVMQKGQVSHAYENVDGVPQLLGKFFLSDNSTDKNITSISCACYKGLLDNNRFIAGAVYNGTLAGTVIDLIMSAAGITEYTVDDETRNTPLYGWLKIQTCRKALREILFGCGSLIDTSRSETLNIYKSTRIIQTTVKRTRKFSTTATEEDYISDISVKYPVYALATATSQIAKGSYTTGTHTIELSSPASGMTINTGTIVAQTNNYITFTLTADADIIITGYKYSKEDLTVTASIENLTAGKTRNSKNFTCTVVNNIQASVIANSLLDYYQLRLGLKIKFLNEGDKPSNWSEIYNTVKTYGNYVAGFEKVTTDLTGGFVSTAELRGYYKLLTDFYYMNEIYAGEDVGII